MPKNFIDYFQESRYRVTDRYIEFQIAKVGIGETWPRLTYNQRKPAWLKIDFDHFEFEDSEEELMNNESNEKEEERKWIEHFESQMKEGKEKGAAIFYHLIFCSQLAIYLELDP